MRAIAFGLTSLLACGPATRGGLRDASADTRPPPADVATDAPADTFADVPDALADAVPADVATDVALVDTRDASDATMLACPTPPADLLEAHLGGPGNPILQRQASGQIVAIPLPDVAPNASAEIEFGETPAASTPQPVTLEFSVSRCRGVIDSDVSNYCNVRSTNGNFNSVTYLAQPYMTLDDFASVNARGYCWAPASEGQWYLNARWTYAECGFGSSTCGFAIQYNYGPY